MPVHELIICFPFISRDRETIKKTSKKLNVRNSHHSWDAVKCGQYEVKHLLGMNFLRFNAQQRVGVLRSRITAITHCCDHALLVMDVC